MPQVVNSHRDRLCPVRSLKIKGQLSEVAAVNSGATASAGSTLLRCASRDRRRSDVTDPGQCTKGEKSRASVMSQLLTGLEGMDPGASKHTLQSEASRDSPTGKKQRLEDSVPAEHHGECVIGSLY